MRAVDVKSRAFLPPFFLLSDIQRGSRHIYVLQASERLLVSQRMVFDFPRHGTTQRAVVVIFHRSGGALDASRPLVVVLL